MPVARMGEATVQMMVFFSADRTSWLPNAHV